MIDGLDIVLKDLYAEYENIKEDSLDFRFELWHISDSYGLKIKYVIKTNKKSQIIKIYSYEKKEGVWYHEEINRK